ncbi:MAG: DUF1524 domain-containing protein, partial [Actinobacteria bacterium]|nr:DUF1524 domain-containing protein [Actinomycetota bacterium]
EHILPQNENLSQQWRIDLGSEWQRIQRTWLHTLGNLTLTGYNPELSDRPFTEKRDMKGGFAESPLRMNESLANLERWTEEAIAARADVLAKQAVRVWRAPRLESAILDAYRPKAAVVDAYTIGDHPNLRPGPTLELFEAFRRQVLALDPAVTQEFLKLYVAFKAETNFVDVIPRAKSLRLSLNMKFPEISDPRGMCEDVTNRGRWGNGDVALVLASLEEIPYVMGLVRQSFERQMGNGADV